MLARSLSAKIRHCKFDLSDGAVEAIQSTRAITQCQTGLVWEVSSSSAANRVLSELVS
jgi:hypothetical protein